MSKKVLCIRFMFALGLLSTALSLNSLPVQAIPEPSFKVTCVARKIDTIDPIVYPGQTGKAHMHTFFGARSVDVNMSLQSLQAAPESACGRNYGVDRSSYWVPALYKNNQLIYDTDGQILEMTAYYKRSKGSSGASIAQAFPQGLRMIAGDMHATTPQNGVWFKCAGTADFGNQNSLGQTVPSCKSSESLVAEMQFPDCWNGTGLDATDHKSHMSYAADNGSCPTSHPVKLPKLIMEVNYKGINGSADSFRFSSGGPYSFHADVFSAWDARAFAALTNTCLNFAHGAIDCNPLLFNQVNTNGVTQKMIDDQTKWATMQPMISPAPEQSMATRHTAASHNDQPAMASGTHHTAGKHEVPASGEAAMPTSLPNAGPASLMLTGLIFAAIITAYGLHYRFVRRQHPRSGL